MLSVGTAVVKVEIANTTELQEKGLGGRKALAKDSGMLFVFAEPGEYGFWMKDMLFPLDIIWVSSDFHITHIEHSLATSTYPTIFYPHESSQYVLEVSSGTSEKLNLKEGDSVSIF